MKKEIKLEEFQVELLEQRLEMGSWSAGVDKTPKPNSLELEKTPYVRHTIRF